MLNVVEHESTILEEAAKGTLSVKTATEAAQTALKFSLGNALMQINRDRRPPGEIHFSPQEIHNLNIEVQKMLNKHDIQMVPPQQTNKGFHSQLLVVPKKDGGINMIQALW